MADLPDVMEHLDGLQATLDRGEGLSLADQQDLLRIVRERAESQIKARRDRSMTVAVNIQGIPAVRAKMDEIGVMVTDLKAEIALIRYDKTAGLVGWYPDGEDWSRSSELGPYCTITPAWQDTGTTWAWRLDPYWCAPPSAVIEASEEEYDSLSACMADADAAYRKHMADAYPGSRL